MKKTAAKADATEKKAEKKTEAKAEKAEKKAEPKAEKAEKKTEAKAEKAEKVRAVQPCRFHTSLRLCRPLTFLLPPTTVF